MSQSGQLPGSSNYSSTFGTYGDKLDKVSSSHYGIEPPCESKLFSLVAPVVLPKSHLFLMQFHAPAQMSCFWPPPTFTGHMLLTQPQENSRKFVREEGKVVGTPAQPHPLHVPSEPGNFLQIEPIPTLPLYCTHKRFCSICKDFNWLN